MHNNVWLFYSMPTIDGLFHAEVSLRIMVSDYIQYKNIFSKSF